jgi:hypothetical protein
MDRPLSVEQLPDGTLIIEGVHYAPCVFRFLAEPQPNRLYRFTRGQNSTAVQVMEFDAKDPLLDQALEFLRRAETRIAETTADRDTALSLADGHRKQAREIMRLAREAGLQLPLKKPDGDSETAAAA